MGATLIDAMDNEYRTDETLSCNPVARRALRFGLNSLSLLFPDGIVIRFFSSGDARGSTTSCTNRTREWSRSNRATADWFVAARDRVGLGRGGRIVRVIDAASQRGAAAMGGLDYGELEEGELDACLLYTSPSPRD